MLFRTITTFMNASGRYQFLENVHQAANLEDVLKAWVVGQTSFVRDNLTALEVYEEFVDRDIFSPHLGKRIGRLVRFFGKPLILRYPKEGLPA